MNSLKIIKAMLAAGCTADQIAVLAKELDELLAEADDKLDRQRAQWRERQQKRRLSRGHHGEVTVTSRGHHGDISSPPLMVSPSSPLVLDNTPPSLNPPSPRTNQGKRLPEDWHPRAEDGLDNQELAKFRDYWKAVPGQKGIKLDWDATWRNWLRTAGKSPNAKTSGNQFITGHAKGLVKPEPEAPKLTEEQLAERARRVNDILKGIRSPVSGIGEPSG